MRALDADGCFKSAVSILGWCTRTESLSHCHGHCHSAPVYRVTESQSHTFTVYIVTVAVTVTLSHCYCAHSHTCAGVAADDFGGAWKLERSDNFDAYLASLNVKPKRLSAKGELLL